MGCHDLTNQHLPAGIPDPSSFSTPAGAMGMRNAAVYNFELALQQYIIDSGLLTDELTDIGTGFGGGGAPVVGLGPDPLDERSLPERMTGTGQDGSDSYSALQKARGSIDQAIGALAAYDTSAPPALRGELYALNGYLDILLADFFCSGVPLSTLDFEGDYTYHPGSTTQQVYADAVAKFDTAIALSNDSARILNLARVGKARALLDMDSVTAATTVAALVPDGFQDTLALQWTKGNQNKLNILGTIADAEGRNGFRYRTGDDPRTRVVQGGTSTLTHLALYFPDKYQRGLGGFGYAPVLIASWIEARLIRAEADLRAHNYNAWLTTLNALRDSATVVGQTEPLDPLTDPGDTPNDSARVALLFHERAAWLFLDGHRQGDLRRLIRQYGWPQDAVYPTGPYFAPGIPQYGSDVNAPVPVLYEDPNPLFHGCYDRNA
jgi:hypothetical protein